MRKRDTREFSNSVDKIELELTIFPYRVRVSNLNMKQNQQQKTHLKEKSECSTTYTSIYI